MHTALVKTDDIAVTDTESTVAVRSWTGQIHITVFDIDASTDITAVDGENTPAICFHFAAIVINRSVVSELNKAVAAGHTDSPAEIAHPFRGIRAFICNLAVIDFNDAVSAGMDRASCDAGHRDVTVVDADMGIVDSSNTGTDTEKIVGAIAFQMKVGIFDLITAVSFDKNAIK